MLSSPSACAMPAKASSAVAAVAVLSFCLMAYLPWVSLSGLHLAAVDEKECRDENDREEQERHRYRIDFRRSFAAKLAKHVGRQSILAARLYELGDHHVVQRD